MFKYLLLSATLREMMVMLTSLPTCTVAFDRNAKLVEINQSALSFFKIKSVDDFKLKRWRVLNDYIYIQRIIKQLNTGAVVKDVICVVKTPEHASVIINFSACMLNGPSKVFLFQFFEFSDSSSRLIKQNDNISQLSNFYLSRICNLEESVGVLNLSLFNKKKLEQDCQNIDENKVLLVFESILSKYPYLSNMETFICVLIALGISTNEIAVITQKKINQIYAIIYKLIRIDDFKSRKELSARLTEIYRDCF